MNLPTNVAPDQARHDYIARVYKMTHAELFAELMRVHTEANRLVNEAVATERQNCVSFLMELHEAAKGEHNYYQFAAEQLRTPEGQA